MKALRFMFFLFCLFWTEGLAADQASDLAKSWAAVMPNVEPRDLREAARLYLVAPHSQAWLRKLAPYLHRSVTAGSEALADTLEHPGNSLDFKVSVDKGVGLIGKIIPYVAGGRIGGHAGTGGAGAHGGLEIGETEAAVSTSSDPKDRSVGASVSMTTRVIKVNLIPRANEKVKYGWSLDSGLQYKDQRDFYRAHGFDAAALPGGATSLWFVDQIMGHEVKNPLSQAPRSTPEAVVRAFQRSVFPNAELVTNAESFTGGTGAFLVYEVEHPPGSGNKASIKLSWKDLRRVKAGQRRGRATRYFETSLEFKLGRKDRSGTWAKLGSKRLLPLLGKAAALGGGVTFAITHSTDPKKRFAKPDPYLKRVAILLRDGNVARARDVLIDKARSRTSRLLQGAPGDTRTPKPKSLPKTWLLPKRPGGIALKPDLELPDIGEPRELTVDFGRWRLVLVTSKGRYRFADVDPQQFATVFRTMANGEYPWVTIGSEKSRKTGYAKVTYATTIRDTEVGALLYRADIQFKGIFLRFPLGSSYQVNRPNDSVFRDYPGHGGEFTRFWITSSGFELVERMRVLRIRRHGMQINSETTLRGEVIRDRQMESFADRLSAKWDDIARRLPEFRAVQDVGLATAVAFWARANRVRVNDALTSLPPRYEYTPRHSPVVIALGRISAISGGVTLVPEEKGLGFGRSIVFQAATLLDQWDQEDPRLWLNRLKLVGIAGGTAILILLIPAGLLWVFGVRSFRGALSKPESFFKVLALWILVLITHFFVTLLFVPLVSASWLPLFERNFLAFLAAFVAFPVILHLMIRFILQRDWIDFRAFNLRNAPGLSVTTSILAIAGPFLSSKLSVMTAALTIAIFGVIPSPVGEKALNLQLSPARMLFQAMVTIKEDFDEPDGVLTLPVPRSLDRELKEPFKLVILSESPTGRVMDLSEADDPYFPVKSVKRIDWPKNVHTPRGITHYSVNGKPPY